MTFNYSVKVDIVAVVYEEVADLGLDANILYEVNSIDMGAFYTSVMLVEKGNKSFNSVLFRFYYRPKRNQLKEINIYKSPLFNPYIGHNAFVNVETLLWFEKQRLFKKELKNIRRKRNGKNN